MAMLREAGQGQDVLLNQRGAEHDEPVPGGAQQPSGWPWLWDRDGGDIHKIFWRKFRNKYRGGGEYSCQNTASLRSIAGSRKS